MHWTRVLDTTRRPSAFSSYFLTRKVLPQTRPYSVPQRTVINRDAPGDRCGRRCHFRCIFRCIKASGNSCSGLIISSRLPPLQRGLRVGLSSCFKCKSTPPWTPSPKRSQTLAWKADVTLSPTLEHGPPESRENAQCQHTNHVVSCGPQPTGENTFICFAGSSCRGGLNDTGPNPAFRDTYRMLVT
jgi:hypothetical protein